MSEPNSLMAAFARNSEKIALSDGIAHYTYAELAAHIRLWSGLLDHIGAERVAYQLPNGWDWAALDIALLNSGRIAVPLPAFFSAAQSAHALTVAGIDTCVTVTDAIMPANFAQSDQFSGTSIYRRIDAGRRQHPKRRGESRLPETTSKITFTSGTTGAPKGVCLSAAHLLRTAQSVCQALESVEIERHMCVLPLPLLLENVAGLYANLLNGGQTVIVDLSEIGLTGSSGLEIEAFVEAQQKLQPHSLILVPQLLLALTAAAEFGMELPSSYKFLAVGGGKLPPSLIERARTAGLPAYEGYGLSECGSVISLNLPDADQPGSTGKPLPHVDVRVCDGEIVVRGSVGLGYCDLGGEPVEFGAEIRTGDIGRIDDDGFVHVDGRKKNHMISSYGRNLSPEWVESELTCELSIASALVFGDAQPAIVALIVPRANATDDTVEQAVSCANERLPDYARISAWETISEAEFKAAGCLTENGRPKRAIVEQQFACKLGSLYKQIKEYA